MAEHRHKRETNARLRPSATVVAAPLALVATAAAVTVGVLSSGTGAADLSAASSSASTAHPARGAAPVTRSESRATASPAPTLTKAPYLSKQAAAAAIQDAHLHEWATTDLNLWSQPGDQADQVGSLDAGKKVLVTGRTHDGRDEVVVDHKSVWVTDGYLSKDKPLGAGAGLSHEPCPDSSVERGLVPAMVYVYRSVCHAFPQITSYGGLGPRPEHDTGHALDIMTTDVTLGNAIAAFVQEHASELDIYDIIWRQHIWTPVRASEGWRLMPNRGSETANHMNHVHVGVN